MPTKIIKFNPTSKLAEQTVPPPKPARSYFPDWYKKAPVFPNNEIELDEANDVKRGLKLCVPFMDSMSAGYIHETWQDIMIGYEEVEEGSYAVKYNFPTEPRIINSRDRVNVPIGDEFYSVEFTFHPAWVPELPEGWSMLYVSPFNRLDLPFEFLSGIVDADAFTQSQDASNIPFYVKKDFTGIIPKGTPFLQMIPVKRESWESVINPYSEDEQNRIVSKTRQYFWGGYKKAFWSKKSYN